MYLQKTEASVQSTLRARTTSTITLAETRVIVSVCVCVILKARVRCETGQESVVPFYRSDMETTETCTSVYVGTENPVYKQTKKKNHNESLSGLSVKQVQQGRTEKKMACGKEQRVFLVYFLKERVNN